MCNFIALKQRWKTEAVGVELKAYAQGLPFRILTFYNSVLFIIKIIFEFLQINIGSAHLPRYFHYYTALVQENKVLYREKQKKCSNAPLCVLLWPDGAQMGSNQVNSKMRSLC